MNARGDAVSPVTDPPEGSPMNDQARLRRVLTGVTAELRDTRDRLRALESAAGEPVAIVGMSCRFPGGVCTPDELWDLVSGGVDAIGEFPSDRGWRLDTLFDVDGGSGTSYVDKGGFLLDAGEFDARFFGVSPREALAMDPQQRLLLETSWELLEQAGIDPESVRGSRTGVFVGSSFRDYGARLPTIPEEVEGHAMTGVAGSVASGRIAYTFGLTGPAVTVDTACSSSLVALHLAAQALRQDECGLAIAGGVAVMSSPDLFTEFSRQQGLSKDGRCRAFAASAAGMGAAEGVGLVLLERLSDAVRNGHRVLAVVRGSAVNQDGASSGLTAPSGPAQERVIHAALKAAGLTTADVDVVEAHGTGTALGDPIEARALLATYGQDRAEAAPALLGSVKSNIGHTQAAAGVAGVMKMVLAIRHGVVPATLHVDEPTPHVDWTSGAVELVRENTAWPEITRSRRAAVSSFGVSGTNAHVILEQAPEPEQSAVDATLPALRTDVVPLMVSGRTAGALRGQAARLREFVAAGTAEPTDVGWSSAVTRAGLEHRAVVLSADMSGLLAGLDAVTDSAPAQDVISGVAPDDRPDVVFVFPGQGSQWAGMATGLLDTSPAFAESITRCAKELAAHVDWDLIEVLRGGSLDRVDVVQPVLWAVMVSLAEVWRSLGITPAAVIGHSQGEIAAACVAGALSLADGARLVALRSKVIADELAGMGGMVSIAAGVSQVAALLDGRDHVWVATVNGPSATVVAGAPDALADVMAAAEEQGLRAKAVAVDYASHTPHVERIRDHLLALAAPITPRAGDVPMYSTVTAAKVPEESLDAEYWYRNLRGQVRFHETVDMLLAKGETVFLEVSPHPVLAGSIDEAGHTAGTDVRTVGTLRLDHGGPRQVLTSLAQLWTAGVTPDWAAVFGTGASTVELPAYAFEREHYWLHGTGGAGDVAAAGLSVVDHPLLAAGAALADGSGYLFTGRLSTTTHPWLADHVVDGRTLVAGTALVELAMLAGEHAGCDQVDELILHAPLVLPASGASVEIQVAMSPMDHPDRHTVRVHSRPHGEADAEWTCHATGTLTRATEGEPAATDTTWPPAEAVAVPLEDLYETLAASGYQYGPAFRGVRSVWRYGDEVFAEVSLPEPALRDVARFGVHPALVDAALQSLLAVVPSGERLLPFSFTGIRCHATGATTARVRLVRTGPDTVSVRLTDHSGLPIVTVDEITSRKVEFSSARPDSLFELTWSPLAVSAPVDGPVVVLGTPAAPTIAALAATVRTGDGPAAVLLPCGQGADADVPDTAYATVATVLTVIQDWLQHEELAHLRLVLLTYHGVAVSPDEQVDPAQAAARGLLRSAAAEHPGRFVAADVDDDTVADLAARFAAAADEPEIAVRAGVALVPRLARVGQTELAVPDTEAWSLDLDTGGSLEDLRLMSCPAVEKPLEPGEVRVGVRATGVNFRDVLVALGVVPNTMSLFACEGSGVVLEVGSGVTDLAVGDRVFGLFSGSYGGPVAVADRRMLARMPAGWSFAEAATVPAVYLTAYYALVDVAGVRAGESLLVHAAAGGVGMAAVGLARHFGVEVYATASEPKWPAVRDLGVPGERIASSRSLEFGERFAQVDVVLNCLAREFTDASLGLVFRGGRFVELGKTDIRAADEVAARWPGVTYRAIDLADAGAGRLESMLAELLPLFEQGVLSPLPVTAWDVRRAPEAFRYMSQARHVGKVVLTAPSSIVDGTVLVTGGTGVVGSAVARHLARAHGVREVVLASRRGATAPGADAVVADLAAHGVAARVVECDVADRDAVAALVADIPDLCGVVHAAGVLDDGVVATLSPDRLDTVFEPKVDAAWHLHELTKDRDLGLFALFSSAAGVFGAPGQGNYAAANAFLDALAYCRRRQGLPAHSLAWGLWADRSAMTGGLGQSDVDRMVRQGIRALDTDDALALFDTAVRMPRACLVPVRLDLTGSAPHNLLRGLLRAPARRTAVNARVVATVIDEQQLVDLVRTNTAVVLGHQDSGAVATDRAFKDLGLDSLTAVELRNRLGAATGLRLPVTVVFEHPTLVALARELRRRLAPDDNSAPVVSASIASADDDPIVIVGMSCRFPGGVRSPADLWDLLVEGRDAVAGYPADRGWDVDVVLDREFVREGGFLTDMADFDAEFFGIAPREALAMDPQQRQLLETTWEAFESAGIDPASLHGTQTGVFAGLIYNDYASRFPNLLPGLEGFLGNGSANSVATGRIAYTLGLNGPAITVDTACSSSLVAMHLAARALRDGECELAVAGGVTVMSTPRPIVEFSRFRGLATDGRCKAFSASADGMGFAEGVGMVVLERLSAAREAGHQVLAILRGSGINQDGASNGLTAPSGPAQERVIRRTLAGAGLAPSDVDVVEAHGTGTPLGDPIEARALLATYGQERDTPLWLGSVKSNIGHAQAAAGVAGVIKMVLAMRHGTVPPTLHADEPTAHVEWGPVQLAVKAQPWPETGRPRRAAISSFGISGTNAHVIIEQPEPVAAPAVDNRDGWLPWVLSARNADSLRDQAQRLLERVHADDTLRVRDVAHSLVTTRTVFEHRAVVVGRDRDDFLRGLSAISQGESAAGVVAGVAAEYRKIAFVFPGQGAQWVGMAGELLDSSPVFAESIARCAVELAAYVDWDLVEVLRGGSLERVDVVQPASWAVMVSLAEVWRAHGVDPDAVVGHSQGELAAACVSGVLSVPDAARIVALRSKLIAAKLSGGGGMMSLALPVAQAEEFIRPWADRICVAVVNGTGSVVVAGEPDALDELLEVAGRKGERARRLPVDYASHTPQIEPLRAPLLDLAAVTPGDAVVAQYSSVTGQLLDTADGEYWYRNLRETVRFDEATRALLDAGHDVFVEVSPHPVLTAGLIETVAEAVVGKAAERSGDVVSTGTLRRDDGGQDRLLTSLAELFVTGVAVDWWPAISGGRTVDLPTYAFRAQRFWLDPLPASGNGTDDRFWSAVREEDPSALAETLRVQDPDLRSSLAAVLPALTAWHRDSHERSVVESWRYRVDWTSVPAGSSELSGTWLVVESDVPNSRADALIAGMERHGAKVLRATVATNDPLDLHDHVRSVVGDRPALTGVLSLTGWDERPHPSADLVPVGFARTTALIQALSAIDDTAPLWCVTTGSVLPDGLGSPEQAMLWGLGRVAAQEHPGRWGGLIDVEADLDERAVAAVCGLLAGGHGEDQLAVRAGVVLARRLVRATRPAATEEWTPTGTALVTGGTGALGGHVARWLASRGAPHVLLLSRRGPDADSAANLVAELTAAGTEVTVLACDVADRAAVADALAQVPDEHPLTAVFHTAAVLDDGPLDSLTASRADRVLRVKVGAARILDELTAHLDLSAFVLFSSTAGTFGAAGQGNYAPGNAYLDAFAHHRRARGKRTTSIAWGAWDEGGMADHDEVAALRRRHGVPAMSPRRATTALGHMLDDDETMLVLADIEWDRFFLAYTAARPSPLLHDLAEVRRLLAETENSSSAGPSVADKLATATRPERDAILRTLVRGHVAAVLGYSGPEDVPVGRPFIELGLDSVTAVELRNRLGGAVGRTLPAGLVFDYPTVSGLVGYLSDVFHDGGGTQALLAELDKVDSAVAALPDDDPARRVVAERMEVLLRRIGRDGPPARQVEATTHDELFALIDNELGMS
ncbi:acyl transferase domain-containing protein/D-arabinose 1-dehydrogenase-like Zn-dependent alcohol dehydrogenase/acyl carrier protein [Kibdelosporangium banguiense]|uniref:Acyl transferase domain-containing protein/D-arabinose 1-dehydrogenase-like Zn-dependent alcohol dehydrogenase/acyl carrier protein n=1 Tax=Kibdelosporangium banguiense TaxID=1365924 RepID=A0ABS4TXP8_9PSEU|nr:type I polyketide synthase [Kibdelosporangium banguiense]MBP2329149.1 acyl transferase domain-containing protein/D-arabinose 1-dehydrogenase-like Zn-dependent alcohol dehydrogenase/acyl carrier protein [Kibdelosporangium banguiense]